MVGVAVWRAGRGWVEYGMRIKCARCGVFCAKPDLTAVTNVFCLPVGTVLMLALGRSVVGIRCRCLECGQQFYAEIRRGEVSGEQILRFLASALMAVSVIGAITAAANANGTMLIVTGLTFAAGLIWLFVMDVRGARGVPNHAGGRPRGRLPRVKSQTHDG